MNISRKLQLNSLLTISITIISGIIIIVSYLESIRLAERLYLSADIIQNIFELNILTNNYIISPYARAETQWLKKNQRLDEMFRAVTEDDMETSQYIEKAWEANKRLHDVFVLLIRTSPSEDDLVKGTPGQNLYRRLINKLLIHSQYMAEAFFHINNELQQNHLKMINYLGVILFSMLAAMAGIVTFNSLFLGKSISKRILKLRKGAASIGGGDLAYRFNICGLNDELENLALTFNQMAESIDQRENKLKTMNIDLQKKNKELDEFTYIASHDLQEPLRKLISFSKLLGRDIGGNLGSRAQKDLEYIIEASDRMQTLIQDLLALSRIGRKATKIGRINLNDCVNEVKELFMAKIEQSGATFITAEFPEVEGDKTLLTQLLQNLVHNALKFNDKERPVIEMTCEEKNGRDIFGVKDNGIGIKPEYIEQIFHPFKRLHGRYEYSGTGIGLSICKKAVEQHNGNIWVESEPNEYTHVRFTLNCKGRYKNGQENTSNHSPG